MQNMGVAVRALRWSVVLVALATAACVSLLVLSGSAWRADSWFYDAVLSHGKGKADDRIVVIVIDDKSLSALGRWPWQRHIHADLLDRLQRAQPRGIALDIMFSEPDYDDRKGDRALASAVARSGRVVLPVMVEPTEPTGTPIEVLPVPELATAAVGLGHVAVDIDPDGVARSAYLRAGLGDPHWPVLAVALHEIGDGKDVDPTLPGLRNPDPGAASPYLWSRDHHVMVPYVASEHFQQVSYIDVMRGQVPDALLRGRWLLVGVTARGSGDSILTPLSTNGGRISGVLYQANLLNMLLQDNAILPLPMAWQLSIAILVVLLPVLLMLRYQSRRAWWFVPVTALVIALSSALLLDRWHYWFAPMASLLTLLVAFALLAFHRLRQSNRLAHSDALTHLANRRLFDIVLKRELAAARRGGQPLSLLLIDVDHFKHYNDTYGHQAGDEMLRKVAGAITLHARRPRDLTARYGGDELAAILPESSPRVARTIADAIVREVNSLVIPHTGSDISQSVTVSIGVATCDPQHEDTGSHLLERTDAALYRAKQLGRNRSYCAPDWSA